ncbi:hypothetical protein [Candidatus Parabeggiatoa sp. HSG14]|uniref:hypothetical protein n=1 Tax=Candidatus Parabeggiatoa sp. HSG14 TaxID=3055593 RepID=UPI0025A7A693|nr:hypothetical protein [Thiotrichales bacterium HSG14]
MKHIYFILNWFFGVLFMLVGVASLVESPLGGICMIVIAVLLLPPARNFVYSKTNRTLSVKARAISVFVLFIAFGGFVGQSQDKKAQELAAQQVQEKREKAVQIRQEKIDYFNANREQIILDVKVSLTAKEYQSVLSQSAKYLVTNDKELTQMYTSAKTELVKIKQAELAEKKRLAEIERLKQADIRKAELAEKKRLAEIEKAELAEKKRLAEIERVKQAEIRQAELAEKKRLAEIEKAELAEKKRLAEIERVKQAEIRQAELAEKKRLAEIERVKQVKIRQAELAEKKRLAEIERVKQVKIRQAELAEKKRLAEIEKAEKTKKILAELKKIPVEQYEKNRDLYHQLAKINPSNKKYREKFFFYSRKLNEANRKWYEGGTLADEKALAWQKASPKNKLATCADILTVLWKSKQFNESIYKNIDSVDDLKPLAEKLVIELDNTFNKQLFLNQEVSETAYMLTIIMKWLKK